MKNLKAWVDDETKTAFCAAADHQGTSESKLLLLVIKAFLKMNPVAPSEVPPTETKDDQFSFRLSTKLKKDLVRRAEQQGMSPSAYLVAMARAHLSQKEFFTEHELDVLNRTNNELTAIGRNINQIAKALNRSLDNADLARSKEIEAICSMVMQSRDEVRSLIRANLVGWGIALGRERY